MESLHERGEVLVIDREVDPEFELAAVTQAVQKRLQRPILFRRVRGTEIPVAANVYGTIDRIAETISTTPSNLCEAWQGLMSKSAPERPTSSTARMPEDLREGRLSDLPLITYCERDAGPYITSAMFLAHEPDSGVRNLSYHRCMYVSDEELRVRLAPRHDLTKYQEKAEQRGEALEAAILIGPPHELFLPAAAPIPSDADELEVASRIAGVPIEMRPCVSIDMEVPRETEVVIEGRFIPNAMRPEGPFGEFMGYYTPVADNKVFEVLRVTWREGAVFHSILCGSGEEVLTLGVAVATNTYARLRALLPGIRDVRCSPFVTHLIVQIAPQYEGHSRQVLLAAMGAQPTWCKVCTVVDEDVDIDDMNDVMWAVLTRSRIREGVSLMHDIPSFYTDPFKDHWGRLAVDATAPFDRRERFERKRIPGAEAIDLAKYLPSE